LVLALARGALAMCAMWVGFYSFLRVGRKKQNKFPSNLHCPVKKLNLFFRYYLSLLYLSGRLSFYTCCQRLAGKCRATIMSLKLSSGIKLLKKRKLSFISYASMAFTVLLGGVAALEARAGACR